MSWLDFESIIGKLGPARADEGLKSALTQLFSTSPGREFTFQRLFQLVRPSSSESLAMALADLEREGTVHRVYRVESPSTHIGLHDYNSIAEIPERLYDETADQELEVDPAYIRPIFRPA